MIDPDQLTHEERTILVWRLACGIAVRPWTQGQEVYAILGILACPEGHTAKLGWAWLDGNAAPLVENGALVSEYMRYDTEGFDVPSDKVGTICRCYDPECEAGTPDFYVPPGVLKAVAEV